MHESVNKTSLLFFHNCFETLTAAHQCDIRQASKGDIFMSGRNMLQHMQVPKSCNCISDPLLSPFPVSSLYPIYYPQKTKFEVYLNISTIF